MASLFETMSLNELIITSFPGTGAPGTAPFTSVGMDGMSLHCLFTADFSRRLLRSSAYLDDNKCQGQGLTTNNQTVSNDE